jgi:fructose-1-phosphate kinase PfkB-like protein
MRSERATFGVIRAARVSTCLVLTELGAETLAFGLTGGGAGYIVKSLLHERGIAFVSVDVLEETRINFIFTDRSDRTQTRISSPGPWVTLDEADRLAALVLGQTPMPPGGSLAAACHKEYQSISTLV